MTKLLQLLIRGGVLTGDQIKEVQRWGFQQEPVEAEPITDLQQFIQRLSQALEGEDLIIIRETDLEVLHTFVRQPKKGELRFELKGSPPAKIPINYAVLRTGEHIIPWVEELPDLFVDPNTYLVTESGALMSFGDVRELFYGEDRTFVVCTPLVIDTPPPPCLALPSESKDNGSGSPDDRA